MGGIASLFSDTTETTNVNETNNISTPAASQSGDAASAAVVAQGPVTLTIDDTSDEAIQGALHTVQRISDNAGFTHQDNLRFLENTISSVGGAIKDVLDETLFIGQQNTQAALDFGNDALSVADEAIFQNAETGRAALFLAEDLNRDNTNFLIDTFSETIGTIEALDESRGIESRNVIEAVTELGQVVSTGGESLKTEANKFVQLGVILVLGVVAWQAVRS